MSIEVGWSTNCFKNSVIPKLRKYLHWVPCTFTKKACCSMMPTAFRMHEWAELNGSWFRIRHYYCIWCAQWFSKYTRCIRAAVLCKKFRNQILAPKQHGCELGKKCPARSELRDKLLISLSINQFRSHTLTLNDLPQGGLGSCAKKLLMEKKVMWIMQEKELPSPGIEPGFWEASF